MGSTNHMYTSTSTCLHENENEATFKKKPSFDSLMLGFFMPFFDLICSDFIKASNLRGMNMHMQGTYNSLQSYLVRPTIMSTLLYVNHIDM